jgi:hypothetical protein
MTIFGFNTNVKLGDVAYHVQSEARPHDLVLQTLVFVSGQCVGKHTYSYAAQALESGVSDETMHELLKAQHKKLLDALHEGQLDKVLGSGGDVFDVGGSRLALKWMNPAADSHGASIGMEFHVEDSGRPAAGADIAVFPGPASGSQAIARSATNAAGNVTLTFASTPALVQEGVIVRAAHGGQSATRKFRFKK